MITSDLYNLQAEKVVEFVGSDLGRMTSDESNTLDGASIGAQLIFPSSARSSVLRVYVDSPLL